MPEDAEKPKLTIHTDFQPLKDAFAEIGKSLTLSFDHITAAFAAFKEPVTQQSYALQSGITAEQLAVAFDVPLEAISPPGCVNHSPQVPGHLGASSMIHEQVVSQEEWKASQGWASPYSDPVADIKKAAAYFQQKPASVTIPLKDVNPDFIKTVYGTDLAAHDGETVTVIQHHTYDVLGKAQPVIVSFPQHFEPEEHEAYFSGDGDPFEGYPKAKLMDAFPLVSTAKGGLKFTTPSWPEDGTRHIGPDDSVWEFRLAGGWRVVEYPPGSTASTSQKAPYGWWCAHCEEHMTVHKGDPVACDSGGWCRPATSAEHKLAALHSAG